MKNNREMWIWDYIIFNNTYHIFKFFSFIYRWCCYWTWRKYECWTILQLIVQLTYSKYTQVML